MRTIFINTENSRMNEPRKFLLNLLQRLDLRRSNKHVALQNVSVYYNCKNIRQQYKKKLRIIAPTWSDEFYITRLVLFSVRYSRLHWVHHWKSTNYLFHIHINRNKNRLVFKVTDGYKLELKLPETMKLFGSTKKTNRQNKERKNILSLEVVEAVLVKCNLIDDINKSRRFCSLLCPITLLNVEPSNLVFLKTYHAGFDDLS